MNLTDLCGTDHPLLLALKGGNVIRYHAEGKHLGQQSVADHTWRVLAIILYFWPTASRKLLLSAIYHDAPEGVTGDMPRMIKDQIKEITSAYLDLETEVMDTIYPELGELDFRDQSRLSFADILEVCLYVNSLPRCHIVDQIEVRAYEILEVCINNLEEDDHKHVARLLKISPRMWG